MRLWRWTTLLIFGSCAISCSAQYRVLPGNVDGDGFPTTPARICLGSTETAHCYTPPEYMKGSPFGLDPKAQIIGKLEDKSLIIFTSTFSAGGSGNLTNFALLTIKSGDFVNLLPKLQLTNQSEYKVWNLPQISSLPILVTADFVWEKGETHLANHHFMIRVFLFDAKTGQYIQQDEYITAKKYQSLDEADAVRILDPEKTTILTRLQKSPSH